MTEPRSKRLLITVHGIRTYGHWQDRLGELVRRSDTKFDLIERPYRYGYFTIFAFIVPLLRRVAIKAFSRRLRNLLDVEQYDRVDIVAHSFGTFLVIKTLLENNTYSWPKINTVILCGSVLPPDINLDPLTGPGRHVGRIVNDCGTQDSVLLLTLAVFGVGMGGRLGLHGFQGGALTNRFFRFGHGGYFIGPPEDADQFMRQWWLPVLLCEAPPIPHSALPDSPPPIERLWRFLGENGATATIAFYAFLLAALAAPATHILLKEARANTARLAAQSRFLARESAVLSANTRPIEALLVASAGVRDETSASKTQRNRPMVPEAYRALYRAVLGTRGTAITQAHSAAIRRIVLDHSGKHFVTTSKDGESTLWSVRPLNKIRTFTGSIVAFDRINHLYFMDEAGQIKIIDLSDVGRETTFEGGPYSNFALHPAEAIVLASNSGGAMSLLRQNNTPSSFPTETALGCNPPILKFSPAGDHVVGACSDGLIRILRINNPAVVLEAAISSEDLALPSGEKIIVGDVEFSPDSAFIVVNFGPSEVVVNPLDISNVQNDSTKTKLIVTGLVDHFETWVTRDDQGYWSTEALDIEVVRPAERYKDILSIANDSSTRKIRMGSTSKTFLFTEDELLSVHQDYPPTFRLQRQIDPTAFGEISMGQSQSSVRYIDPAGRLHVLRLDNGMDLFVERPGFRTGSVTFFTHSDLGAFVVVGSSEGAIQFWEISTEPASEPLIDVGLNDFISKNPDISLDSLRRYSRPLLAVTSRHVVELADLAKASISEVARFADLWRIDSEVNPSATRLALLGYSDVMPDGTPFQQAGEASQPIVLRSWNLLDIRAPATRFLPYAERSVHVTVSEDGTKIGTINPYGDIFVYDANELAKVASAAPEPDFLPDGFGDEIEFLRFDAKTEHVLALWDNGTVRVWDIKGGGPPKVFRRGDARIINAAFSSDASKVATLSNDGAVGVWDVNSAEPLGEAQVFLTQIPVDQEALYSLNREGDRSVTITRGTDATQTTIKVFFEIEDLIERTKDRAVWCLSTAETARLQIDDPNLFSWCQEQIVRP